MRVGEAQAQMVRKCFSHLLLSSYLLSFPDNYTPAVTSDDYLVPSETFGEISASKLHYILSCQWELCGKAVQGRSH
jgi:hypothetical protein